ncbi:MAG: energy transducer TonB [Chitinophagales bacterium]|nr:energy transducer TonB [Chitinophagales bacterium]
MKRAFLIILIVIAYCHTFAQGNRVPPKFQGTQKELDNFLVKPYFQPHELDPIMPLNVEVTALINNEGQLIGTYAQFQEQDSISISHTRFVSFNPEAIKNRAKEHIRHIRRWTPGTLNDTPTVMLVRLNVHFSKEAFTDSSQYANYLSGLAFVPKEWDLVKDGYSVYQKADDGPNHQIYTFAEQMPEYPGGITAILKYIAEHTIYPEVARENDITGTVYVKFVVTREGNVRNVVLVKAIDPYLDQEAVRVVSSLSGFRPGMQSGKPVEVFYTIPIKFILQ